MCSFDFVPRERTTAACDRMGLGSLLPERLPATHAVARGDRATARVSGLKFGAEVAKESARNEKIAKKSLKTKSRAYAYAPKGPMRTHCHALGVTS
ncbi:hypothetical protein PIB30_078492 [Stylosanthes scabra]|uniref:Uncharacterized protein n=1 Tax=Stylosanthes scabra TaxID=79078 RepID=A0ABU6QQE1_9FABA|nr:hypothetical protein [Stylosanthes scabra]